MISTMHMYCKETVTIMYTPDAEIVVKPTISLKYTVTISKSSGWTVSPFTKHSATALKWQKKFWNAYFFLLILSIAYLQLFAMIHRHTPTKLCYFPVTSGFCVLFNQSINQSIHKPINQSIHQSILRSINQSIHQSIDPSINQSINPSINRSIIQSINQSINQYSYMRGKVLESSAVLLTLEAFDWATVHCDPFPP